MSLVGSAVMYAVGAFLLVWPLVVLAGTGLPRRLVLAASFVGILVGAAFVFVPSSARLPIESILLKGGTLWAGLCLLLAMLDVSGLGALRRRVPAIHLGILLALALTALPLSAIGLMREVRTSAFLKESAVPWLSAGAVVAATAAACWLLTRWLERIDARKYVTLWSYLLVAPIVHVVIQPSILSNIETTISRVSHDWMHAAIMLLAVPDHVYLSGKVWGVIGFAFMKSTGTMLNVLLYAGVVLFVVLKQSSLPLPVLEGETPPERRRRWARLKAQRRIVFVPVLVSMFVFAYLAYAGWASEGAPRTPTPVALPATGIETATLADRELHSFQFGAKGDKRVIAILKPDGTYSVCLDACLICPPDGYAQLGGDLFCLYCGTPIPIATVGQPGGCNPIPVPFRESGGRLVFDTAQAEKTWEEANRNK